MLLYTGMCIGHDVAFRGLEEVRDFSIDRAGELEFVYLPGHFASLGVPRPEEVFAQRKDAARVQHIIQSVTSA